MTATKTMLQQIVALFRGNIVHAVSQVMVIGLVSKIGGNESSGNYVLALATTAPIFMFFDLNLRVVRSTDHQHDELFSSYMGLRFYTLLLAVVASFVACGLLYPTRVWVFLPIVAFRIGESLSNLAFGGLQRVHSSDLIGKSLTGKGILSLLTIAFVIPLTSGNEVAAAVAMAIVSVCWATFYDVPLAWKLNQPDTPLTFASVGVGLKDFSACRRIGIRAFPLGFDAGISSLAMNAPKYCIEYYVGTNALGVFGLLSQFAFAMQKLIGAMGHAGVGVLSKHYSSNNRKQFWRLFNRMLGSCIAVSLASVVGGTLVIPFLASAILGPEYGNPWLILGLLLASALTGMQRIAGRATQACGQYLAYTLFDVLIFSVSSVTSFHLVQNFGEVGGAFALVISFAVGLMATLFHAYRLLWPQSSEPVVIKTP